MRNYAAEWKKKVNFKQFSYDDFVSKFFNIPNTFFLEKVDGLLGTLVYREGKKPFFQLSGGGVIVDLPVLYEYEIHLKKLKIKEAILAGELVGRKFGTVLPFNQTQSIVRTAYRRLEYRDLVHHYIVDVCSLNGKKFNFPQSINFMSKNFGRMGLPRIHIPRIAYGNIDTFRKLYDIVRDKPGFDGVVARDIKGNNYKVKFTGTVDLVVIGAGHIDMKAWKKNQVSYLLTSFIDGEGLFRTSSKVGTGFTLKERAALFNYIKDSTIYKKDGEFFVKPKLVIEVKFFRYRMTSTPTYKFAKGRYDLIGSKKSVTLSHPGFERIRTDKKPDRYSCRMEQIPDWGN